MKTDRYGLTPLTQKAAELTFDPARVGEDHPSAFSLVPGGSLYTGWKRGQGSDRHLEGMLRAFAGGSGGLVGGAILGGHLGPGSSVLGASIGKTLGTHYATRGLINKGQEELKKKEPIEEDLKTAEAQAIFDVCSQYKTAGVFNSLMGRGAQAVGNFVAKNPQNAIKGVLGAKAAIRPGLIGAGIGAVGGALGGGEDHRLSGALQGGAAGGALGAGVGGVKKWREAGKWMSDHPELTQSNLSSFVTAGKNFADKGQQMRIR